MKKDNYTIFISLDAMDSEDFNELLKMDALSEIKDDVSIVKEATSVLVSNTYTAHASIVSGLLPYHHGIIDNTIFDPGNISPDWMWHEKNIKSDTIIRMAKRHNIKVASIMWPVTAKGDIKYNLPEIFANRNWDHQLFTSLRNGSKAYQIKGLYKHGKLLKGISQPYLDNFTFEILKDTIKEKKAELIFVHFTDVDSHKHLYGIKSLETKEAINRHGNRLKELIQLLKDEGILKRTTIFMFGDHGQFDVKKGYKINEILEEIGLCKFENGKLLWWEAWFKCCGGTAFLRIKNKNNTSTCEEIKNILKDKIEKGDYGIKRFLEDEELLTSGFNEDYVLGIESEADSYFYEMIDHKHKANHGYSLKHGNYTTSILAYGNHIKKGVIVKEGSILDICPTALKILNLPSWEMDGKIIDKFIKFD